MATHRYGKCDILRGREYCDVLSESGDLVLFDLTRFDETRPVP